MLDAPIVLRNLELGGIMPLIDVLIKGEPSPFAISLGRCLFGLGSNDGDRRQTWKEKIRSGRSVSRASTAKRSTGRALSGLSWRAAARGCVNLGRDDSRRKALWRMFYRMADRVPLQQRSTPRNADLPMTNTIQLTRVYQTEQLLRQRELILRNFFLTSGALRD
jgi:hypothetical protein